MRRTHAAILATLLTIAAACSDSAEQDSSSETTTTAAADTGIPPEPDQATADAYIAALDAIDPGISRDDPESAIDRGRDQCSTIRANPDDRARQVEAVTQRFTTPDHPDGWGPDIAGQILDVTHQHLCPTY